MNSGFAAPQAFPHLVSQWIVAFGLGVGLLHTPACASDWATGPAFQKRMAQEISVVWSETPLRQVLDGLSRSQNVAILLDRRVDPTRTINLSIDDAPLEKALHRIAQQCGLDVASQGSVVYFGPPSSASRLRPLVTLHEKELHRLPSAAARTFRQNRPMAWDNLAEPRTILADLAHDNQLEISDLRCVPHDLWPAVELPPMPLVERLTLIANQFDLTFRIASDGRSITLIPIPDELTNPRQPSAAEAKAASPESPDGKGDADLDRVHIERLAVREKPIGPVLRQLAERWKLDLQIDEEAIEKAGISMDQRVSVVVENATIDELFRELLKPTGLTFRRSQRTVVLTPAR